MMDLTIPVKIRINRTAISFLSPIDNKEVYTIWENDYDLVIESMKKSREYKRKQEELEKEYR
jgi:hypothetical protein